MPLDYFGYQVQESLTYYPGGVTSAAVSVQAVVVRDQVQHMENSLVHFVDLYLPRGTGANQLNAVEIGQDEVLVNVDPYGTRTRCRVVRLLQGDANMWKVRAAR